MKSNTNGLISAVTTVLAALAFPMNVLAQTSGSNCTLKSLKVSTAVRDGGFSYIISNSFGTPADNSNDGTRSSLRFFENGQELGPAHASHADIRKIGRGRFSHWASTTGGGESIRFATSDNSNPRKNGRTYSFCVGPVSAPSPTPTPATVPAPTATPAPPPAATPGSGPVAVYPMARTISAPVATFNVGAKPAYLAVSNNFSSLGLKLMRITDSVAFGDPNSRLNRHAYSKQQPWNSDGSRIMLAFSWPARLIDGTTYKFIKTFNPPSDPLWSNTDPDLIYGVNGNSFVKLQVASNVQSTLRVFGSYSNISIGGGEGNLSEDGRLVVLIGQYSGGVDILVYNISTNTIVSTKRFAGYTGPYGDIDHASISPSGSYVVVGDSTGTIGYDVYAAIDMRFLRRIVNNQQSHGDLGYTSEGHEAFISSADGQAALKSIRLADGVSRVELSNAHMTWAGHVSCRNPQRKGYCYISNYRLGYDGYLINQNFAVKLDGTGTVELFGPAIYTPNTNQDYERSPMAVPNRNGTLLMFASDWNDSSSVPMIDSYITGVNIP